MNGIEEAKFLEIIEQLTPLTTKLNDMLGSHRVTWKSLTWDMQSIDEKRTKLLKAVQEIESQIKAKKAEAEDIVKRAQEESAKIIEAATNRNVLSMASLEKVKSFVDEVEKRHYLQLKNEVKP